MAIALDTTSNSGAKLNVSSITWSHTCTGSNLVLVVGYGSRDGSSTDGIVTGVTYNGIALTQGQPQLQSSDQQFRSDNWFLVAPATGAHDIVISLTGAVSAAGAMAISLTGCAQTGQPDGTDSNASDVNTTLTIAHPITTANSWLISMGYTRSGTITADTGTDFCNLPVNSADDVVFASYEGPIASTGDHTIQWTESNDGNDWAMSSISIAPAAEAGVTIHTLAAMGVGN